MSSEIVHIYFTHNYRGSVYQLHVVTEDKLLKPELNSPAVEEDDCISENTSENDSELEDTSSNNDESDNDNYSDDNSGNYYESIDSLKESETVHYVGYVEKEEFQKHKWLYVDHPDSNNPFNDERIGFTENPNDLLEIYCLKKEDQDPDEEYYMHTIEPNETIRTDLSVLYEPNKSSYDLQGLSFINVENEYPKICSDLPYAKGDAEFYSEIIYLYPTILL